MRHVILSTDVRTGGTWLSKLFDSHPNTKVLWEPDQKTFHREDDWFTWPFGTPAYTQRVDSFKPHQELVPAFDKAYRTHVVYKLTGPMGHMEMVPDMLECMRAKQRMKFRSIVETLGADVIHLIRHPVCWLTSVMRWSPWPVNQDNCQRWLQRYATEAEHLSTWYQDNPRYTLVKFEDLVTNTREVFSKLLDFVGLSPNEACSKFVRECHQPEVESQNPHQHSVYMKPSTVLNRWKKLPRWALSLANNLVRSTWFSEHYKALEVPQVSSLEQIYNRVAPWRADKQGILFTNPQHHIPRSLNRYSPEYGIPEQLPWVLCYDFTDAVGGFMDLLDWAMEHVAPRGYIIVSLPYSRYLPSRTIKFISNRWPEHTVVLEELLNRKRSVVVVRKCKPSWDSVYLNNRDEVGDTMCLIPLIEAIHNEHPGTTVCVHQDLHNLLRPHGAVVTEKIPDHCCGVLHQTPNLQERAEYYRRIDDFYYYPIRVAKMLGWLQEEYSAEPEVPRIAGKLEQALSAQLQTLGNYVAVAPETNLVPETNIAPRAWRNDRWCEVISWLLQNGQPVVVVGRKKFEFATDYTGYLNLTGQTSVYELGSVIAGARYLIGCDSAPAHIAMGHGVRAIVLEGPTIGVFRSQLVRQVSRQDGGCINCMRDVGDHGPYPEGCQKPLYFCGHLEGTPCMEAITVDQVVDAIYAEHGITMRK